MLAKGDEGDSARKRARTGIRRGALAGPCSARATCFAEGPVAAALLTSEELARAATVRLQAWAQDEVDELLPAKVEARVGKTYLEIVHAAKFHDADLIVIATHGHTGLKHAFLGSTAERVVQHAPCPVLVVRGKEKAA